MKIKVVRIPLQKDKLEAISLGHVDHIDAYECVYEPEKALDARDVALEFVGYRPKWFSALMRLRNWLVKPFGLRTGRSSKEPFPKEVIQGGRIQFFSIHSATSKKVVLYAEDTHLDTNLVMDTKSGRLLVITAVHYRNLFGRIYFFFILPFHCYIVRKFAVHAVLRLM